MKKLLTPGEVAEQLSVSEKTVKVWLWKGKLRGLKAGILWRIREEDLEAFLDPTRRVLENAPHDDEAWTPEDEEAAREAEVAIRQGRVKAWEKAHSRKKQAGA